MSYKYHKSIIINDFNYGENGETGISSDGEEVEIYFDRLGNMESDKCLNIIYNSEVHLNFSKNDTKNIIKFLRENYTSNI